METTKLLLWFESALYVQSHEAQKEIHRGGLKLSVCTHYAFHIKRLTRRNGALAAQTSDVILDVKDIEKQAKNLQGDVSVVTIQNGLHDLVLSAPEVRTEVYAELFQWLEQKIV